MLFANSLLEGYFQSNFVGRGIVLIQLVGSIVMFTAIFGKCNELNFVKRAASRFLRDFTACRDVLQYYLGRRPQMVVGMEYIYKETCERLLKILTPDARSLLMRGNDNDSAALTAREIELVKGACEHALDEAELKLEHGMGLIATVVALSPMLGLLGTVWGVLDAFAEMGTAGSANLATIAPSISSALVTTVVGLLVAIPGVMCYNGMNSTLRNLTSEMEGFADEVIGRIACEFQGRAA